MKNVLNIYHVISDEKCVEYISCHINEKCVEYISCHINEKCVE